MNRPNNQTLQALKRMARLYEEEEPSDGDFVKIPFDKLESARLADYLYDLEQMGAIEVRTVMGTEMIRMTK